MRNLLQNIILVSAAFILSGCAVTVNTTTVIPAGAPSVTDYKTVAVLDFSGNAGKNISPRVEAVISKAEVNNRKQYTVVDRNNINKILQEQQFQMTLANPDTIVEFGELIGAEAIWTGLAQKDFNITTSYETRRKCGNYRDGKCISYYNVSVRCEQRDLKLVVVPKLTSVSTGKIIYSRDFKGSDYNYYCHDYSYAADTESDLYEKVLTKILRNFRIDIAPYTKDVSIKLMDKKDGTNDKSLALLKNGLTFAKNNRMEKACDIWDRGLKETPDSVSLNYNMGVCYELSSKYEYALKYFLKAEDTAGKPVKTISHAIERTKENIENQKKLKRQIHNTSDM